MRPAVIAVDFDGTLCEAKWPEIGEANWKLIHLLKRRQAQGDKLILWTCREGEALEEALLWCLNRGLRFDAVNDNLAENKARYGNNCRKVNADYYLDDKNAIALTFCGGIARMLVPGKTLLDETAVAQMSRTGTTEADGEGKGARRPRRRSPAKKRKRANWMVRLWRRALGED